MPGFSLCIELSSDCASRTAGEGFTDDSLEYSITTAAYGGRLLAVNSQFDARKGGTPPELPFTVSYVPIPESAAPASSSASAFASASDVASPVPDTGRASPFMVLLLAALLVGACALAIGYGVRRSLR